MAYTLMIADDDAMIRKGLSCLIPWEELGFRLSGVFADGKTLLEHLRAGAADAVLTDIRMHEITGLDVARYVCEQHLPTRVVILSGYQEFEYAQQAIRYGVQEYLLKPIAVDTLTDTFMRIRRELDQAYGEQTLRSRLSDRVNRLENRMDRMFLADAYAGQLVSESAFRERCRLSGFGDGETGRKTLLLGILVEEGNADTAVRAMDLACENGSFFVMKQSGNSIEGVLLENSPGALRDTESLPQKLEERIAAVSGTSVRLRCLGEYATLRQFALRQPSCEAAELQGPVPRAESYLRAHFRENVTLNEVAAKIYVNPVYLSRVFHEKTGKTFTEALTQIRMEHARRQLRETHRPITEIARECGYPDTKYFFKQFKRYAGVSPGEWRTMKKDREEEHD